MYIEKCIMWIKSNRSNQHEVHMQRYVHVHKGISVTELQFHVMKHNQQLEEDNQSDHFEISTFEMNS